MGISNFNTFLKNTEDYRRDLRRVEYGDEREPKMYEFLDKISPLNNTDKIKKPLFIIEVSPEMRLLIAPNPATESCRVEFDTRGKLGTLTLTDALGRTVKSVELQGNGQHDFSVADMPSGVYYLRVNAEGKLLASGKLVVEK